MDRTTDDEVLDAVGPRLRALRRDRGITLADLATTTGVSESTLSRLENGQRRPTLELLLPLARTYNVPLDDLVGAPRTGDPRVHLKPVSRFGITFVPLSRRPGGVHAFKMIIPARPGPLEPAPRTHEGFEWLYVLSGRLRLVLGERDLTLPPGEAAEFDTSLPHWLGTADGGAVELLILFGPQGLRAHVHHAGDTAPASARMGNVPASVRTGNAPSSARTGKGTPGPPVSLSAEAESAPGRRRGGHP